MTICNQCGQEVKEPELPPIVPLAAPDTAALEKMVHEYITYCQGPDYFEDNEWKYYIFETAIAAFYGACWPLLNKHMNRTRYTERRAGEDE